MIAFFCAIIQRVFNTRRSREKKMEKPRLSRNLSLIHKTHSFNIYHIPLKTLSLVYSFMHHVAFVFAFWSHIVSIIPSMCITKVKLIFAKMQVFERFFAQYFEICQTTYFMKTKALFNNS